MSVPVRRLLVVANETLAGDDLYAAIDELAGPGCSIYVVCPVLVSRSRYWTSDLGGGLLRARQRLLDSLDALRARGLRAEGSVGDADPVLAIEDGLRVFAAEHVLVATHPPARSTWLERRVVSRASRRIGPPLTHVVVDLEREAVGR
jgi:GABA permease